MELPKISDCLTFVACLSSMHIFEPNLKFPYIFVFTDPPVFTDKLKNCLVSTDDSAVLTCSFSGKPPPTVSWSLPHHLNAGNKRIEIATTEDSSTFTLQRVTMLDAGDYTCTVENSNGSVSSTAKLDVKGNRLNWFGDH